MRKIITGDPYENDPHGENWHQYKLWPCRWIGHPSADRKPAVWAFRRFFTLEQAETIRLHVTADERYDLFVDGERIGRGPERGDPHHWFFETYEMPLAAGNHTIVARVWALGEKGPWAQLSCYPGLLVSTEGKWIEQLGTGVAAWESKELTGYEFIASGPAWGPGYNVRIDGTSFPWGYQTGLGDGWQPVQDLCEGRREFGRFGHLERHLLRPATLGAMVDRPISAGRVRFVSTPGSIDTESIPVRMSDGLTGELATWNALKTGSAVTVPSNTIRRVIIDLENYYCAYPAMTLSGGTGSVVRLSWSESLFVEPQPTSQKANRDEIEGKYFYGSADVFRPDGGPHRFFETLWWHGGRFLELVIQTADEPLVVDSLSLNETRYPLEMESQFSCSDSRLERTIPIMVRSLRMCCHETYMDCPFYEQLMYVGDTRLEALVTYVSTRDDRLPRKALAMFDWSRLPSGLTQSRYPNVLPQVIAPFSLWWVAMVYDYALWRGDREFVRGLMVGVRSVLERYRTFLGPEGLIKRTPGWNFMDWVPTWPDGVPPDADRSVSAIFNWQFVYALNLAAELEDWFGETELSHRHRKLARELALRVNKAFWNPNLGLFADDLGHAFFSEHAQCLAVLSGELDKTRMDAIGKSLTVKDLARTTIYFSHYLFETFRRLGTICSLLNRLGLWFDLEKQGLTTTPEAPEPSRSDCHAWGAHPIYHYFTSILGIRPGSMGFQSIRIEPQLGPLTHAWGKLVHPKGWIEVDAQVDHGTLRCRLCLPEGLNGTLKVLDQTARLRSGRQDIVLPLPA